VRVHSKTNSLGYIQFPENEMTPVNYMRDEHGAEKAEVENLAPDHRGL